MRQVGVSISLCRLFEHAVLIIIIFIRNNDYKISGMSFWLQCYALCGYVFSVIFYNYLIIYRKATTSIPVSTNRTLPELLKLGLYQEVNQMQKFGYIYSPNDWKTIVDTFNGIDNVPLVDDVIWFALKNGFFDIGTEIIGRIYDMDSLTTNSVDDEEETVLWYAMNHCDTYHRFIDKMIDFNVNLDEIYDDGDSLLCRVVLSPRFDDVIVSTLSKQLQRDGTQTNGDFSLYRACKFGRSEAVTRLLNALVNPDGVYKASGLNRVPLMAALRNGHSDIVQKLINANAEVNLSHKDGMTPLIWASWKGRTDIVQMLINAGADVNQVDSKGLCALDYAENRSKVTQKLLAVMPGGS